MVALTIMAVVSQQSICAAYMFAGSQNNNNSQGTIPAAAVQNFARVSAGSFAKPAALSSVSSAPAVMAAASRFYSSDALTNTGTALLQKSFPGAQLAATNFSAMTKFAAAPACSFDGQFPAAGGKNTTVQVLQPQSVPELFSALETMQRSHDQVTGTVKQIVDTVAEVFEKESDPRSGAPIYDANGREIGEYKAELIEKAEATVKEAAQNVQENIEKEANLYKEEIQLAKQESQELMSKITAAIQTVSVSKEVEPIVRAPASKEYALGDSRWSHVIDRNGRLSWPDSSRGMPESGRKYTCMLTPLSDEEKAQYYAYIGKSSGMQSDAQIRKIME